MKAIAQIGVLEEEIVTATLDPRWRVPLGPVVEVLESHFGKGVDSVHLVPPQDRTALATDLVVASPELADLATESAVLIAAGACCVVIPSLGLAGLPLEDKRKLRPACAERIRGPAAAGGAGALPRRAGPS